MISSATLSLDRALLQGFDAGRGFVRLLRRSHGRCASLLGLSPAARRPGMDPTLSSDAVAAEGRGTTPAARRPLLGAAYWSYRSYRRLLTSGVGARPLTLPSSWTAKDHVRLAGHPACGSGKLGRSDLVAMTWTRGQLALRTCLHRELDPVAETAALRPRAWLTDSDASLSF